MNVETLGNIIVGAIAATVLLFTAVVLKGDLKEKE